MTRLSDLMGLGVEGQSAFVMSTDTVNSSPTRSASVALTAAGTNLATALALTNLVNIVTTTASSTGVALPSNTPVGQLVIVQNNGANVLNIFPHSASGTINAGSAGAAVTTAAAAGALCIRASATDWVVYVTAKES